MPSCKLNAKLVTFWVIIISGPAEIDEYMPIYKNENVTIIVFVEKNRILSSPVMSIT
jgi:hypothetical protein